jgi:ABC-2 type transport system ATP-binding protein
LKQSYAVGRGLVVDVQESGPVAVEGASVIRHEGHRHWLLVPRDQRVPDVVARLLDRYTVEDLTIEEPDIEDIIRRIYRDGAVHSRHDD